MSEGSKKARRPAAGVRAGDGPAAKKGAKAAKQPSGVSGGGVNAPIGTGTHGVPVVEPELRAAAAEEPDA